MNWPWGHGSPEVHGLSTVADFSTRTRAVRARLAHYVGPSRHYERLTPQVLTCGANAPLAATTNRVRVVIGWSDDTLVDVHYAGAAQDTCERLGDVRESAAALVSGRSGDVTSFAVTSVAPLGTKRSGLKGAFRALRNRGCSRVSDSAGSVPRTHPRRRWLTRTVWSGNFSRKVHPSRAAIGVPSARGVQQCVAALVGRLLRSPQRERGVGDSTQHCPSRCVS